MDALTSVAHAARGAFGAWSVSIAAVDGGELVFAAIAGGDSDALLGARFPIDTGIAGLVVRSAERHHVTDIHASESFAIDIATEAGYVPDEILAVPIVRDGGVAAVLSLLDPDRALALPDPDALLAVLVEQAATALP